MKRKKGKRWYECMKKVLNCFLGHMKLCVMVTELMGGGSHIVEFAENDSSIGVHHRLSSDVNILDAALPMAT
jgi:hypothetical protein